MSDVRINGFKYNALDLEQTIMIPDRNRLIVSTYLEYAAGKSTVIFCTSVNHANTIAQMLREKGVLAEAVSGNTWTINHTGVRPEYNGRGIARKLLMKLIEEARARQVKIQPVCSYAKKIMTSSEEYNDLLC